MKYPLAPPKLSRSTCSAYVWSCTGETYTISPDDSLAEKVMSSMTATSFYRFNASPEFSVNHISEYLATDNAPQGTRIIRAAKFPKKVEVAAYSQIRKPLQIALTKPGFDRKGVELLAEKMAAKARRETGYARDEALRCEKAVRAFIDTLQPRSFARMQIGPTPSQLAIKRAEVRIKISLDASVVSEINGGTHSGGIVLLYAFSADRGPVASRLSAMTGLMLWALEQGQMEPLPRLCSAIDIADGTIVRANPAHTRFRERVTDSCHEIASRWDSIEPPEDYDGPDWR